MSNPLLAIKPEDLDATKPTKRTVVDLEARKSLGGLKSVQKPAEPAPEPEATPLFAVEPTPPMPPGVTETDLLKWKLIPYSTLSPRVAGYDLTISPVYGVVGFRPEELLLLRHDYLAIGELRGKSGPATKLIGRTHAPYGWKLGKVERYARALWQLNAELGTVPPGCPDPMELCRAVLQHYYVNWAKELERAASKVASPEEVLNRLPDYRDLIERRGNAYTA